MIIAERLGERVELIDHRADHRRGGVAEQPSLIPEVLHRLAPLVHAAVGGLVERGAEPVSTIGVGRSETVSQGRPAVGNPPLLGAIARLDEQGSGGHDPLVVVFDRCGRRGGQRRLVVAYRSQPGECAVRVCRRCGEQGVECEQGVRVACRRQFVGGAADETVDCAEVAAERRADEPGEASGLLAAFPHVVDHGLHVAPGAGNHLVEAVDRATEPFLRDSADLV